MDAFIIVIIVVCLFGVALWAYLQSAQFGGKITNSLKGTYARSNHWDGKKFLNLEVTNMNISPRDIPGLIKKQFTNRDERSPQTSLPVIPFNDNHWNVEGEISYAWYGHSVVLLKVDGNTILIDPMFGPDASPIAPFAAKRFSDGMLDYIESLPHLDAIFITHDHYDHLDLKSIRKLKGKTRRWWVSLGVGRHLERWGIPKDQIQEFDWWQHNHLNNIKITFTPSRHFSGRGLSDRAGCLWGGWVFESPSHKIYWSGDGGYGNHFTEIGKHFGGFDLAFMECGQYNELWHQIHMYPEEAVQAAIDTNSKISVPVHWGGFNLALHHWKDPIHRFVAEAKFKQVAYSTPQLGEVLTLNPQKQNHWWDNFD